MIGARPSLPAPMLRRLNTALNTTLRIDGFRDASAAPDPLLLRHALFAVRPARGGELAACVLETWLRAEDELASSILALLHQHGFQTRTIAGIGDHLWLPADLDELAAVATVYCDGGENRRHEDALLMAVLLSQPDSHGDAQGSKDARADRREIARTETMKEELAEVLLGIDSLFEEVKTLAGLLEASAARLRLDGTLPEPEVDAALGDLRKHLAALVLRTQDLGDRIPMEPPVPAEISSVGGLRGQLERIESAWRSRADFEAGKRAALSIVDRARSVCHRTSSVMADLEEFKALARDLHSQILQAPAERLPPEAAVLLSGTHPICRLLALVEDSGALDDAQCHDAYEIVAGAFGKILATAALRGKLTLALGSEQQETPQRLTTVTDSAEGPPDAAAPQRSGELLSAEEPARTEREGADGPTAPSDAALEEPTHDGDATGIVAPDTDLPAPSSIDPAPSLGTGFVAGRSASETMQSAGASDDETSIWELMHAGHPELAFHLALAQEQLGRRSSGTVPSWVFRDIVLAPNLLTPDGDIAGALREDFEHFKDSLFDDLDDDTQETLRFLLAAASLRPALLAPSTAGAVILRGLHFQEPAQKFYEYCMAVASCAEAGQPLDAGSLKGVRSLASWEADLRTLQSECAAWCSQARAMTMVYAAATNVWRAWQAQAGIVSSLLHPVCTNDPARRAVVSDLIERLGNDQSIKREIAHTDRDRLKRRGGNEIHATALNQLLGHTRDAVGFARRWIALLDSRPGSASGYLQKRAEEARTQICGLQAEALAELEHRLARGLSLMHGAAISNCVRAIRDVGSLFDPASSLPQGEPLPARVLNAKLLGTAVPLASDWSIEGTAVEVIEGVEGLGRSPVLDLSAAFEVRSSLRDHVATGLLLDYFLETNPDHPDLRTLPEERDRRILECRAALRREAGDAQAAIEKGVAMGLLNESDRASLCAKVDKVLLGAEESLAFRQLPAELDAVRSDIDERRRSVAADVERRMAGMAMDEEVRERVLRALRSGDLLAAHEYIECARSGRPLPPASPERDAFSRFFPEAYQAIYKFLEPADAASRPDPQTMVRELAAFGRSGGTGRSPLGPVSLRQVPGAQVVQASTMLAAWYSTKRARSATPETLQAIFTGLGFPSSRVSPERSGKAKWYRMSCETLRDRDLCPVALYGSAAHGSYRILCVWDRPTEDGLLSEVAETAHQSPAIVLFFGRMSAKVRRDLAERSRRRRRTLLVIDDVLMLHLCGERGSRLPAMFRCALPFTFCEPYAVTAGLVPAEMFYGREAERRQIMEATGSCFIYGGRQLGKTALLRDVERVFHDPSAGRIALWLDLKTYGIGIDRPIEELWHRLGVEFKKLGVIPTSMPAHASIDAITDHIARWLDAEPDRRILLLLDEADRFLDQDGKGDFTHTDRLKGLMDRTERRFKVVLAGLHNVQRTTRLENNPLAHYGEPICIGPLLKNDEWKEAQNLIEQPMASVGYRFESPDLVTRILSQTNYYPSLIQLYCNQLLRHMLAKRSEAAALPQVISSDDVEEAYRSQELRKAIHDRFTWTLDLDPRYRLIAFCLALHCSEQPELADRGVTVAWIREQAMSFWAKGFREVLSEDVFRVLLDEMVGLGVLRVVDINSYALRSLNIVTLLGSREEIEAEICSFLDREPPPPFEPATFRSAFRLASGGVDPARRNPLTAAQESLLRRRQNGVSVLFGCAAAGIDDLGPFLELAVGADFLVTIDGAADLASFNRKLAALDTRQQNGVTIVLVASTCPWSTGWVDAALSRTARLVSKNSFVRVLFVADSLTAWAIAGDIENLEKRGVSTINLSPWHDAALQHWLDETGLTGVQEKDRSLIAEVTGLWAAPLRLLHERTRNAPHQWRAELDRIAEEITSTGRLDGLDPAKLFGLERREARAVLQDLADLNSASLTDLVALREGAPEEVSNATVTQVITWGCALGIIQPAGGKEYRVDGFVGRMLRASSKVAP